jgi:membrane-associated phospholipid phosphatase
MASLPRNPYQSIADAAAERVDSRRGEGSKWSTALRELGAVDRAAYEAVALTPTPTLDEPIRKLTKAASYSRLWFGIAAAIAALAGKRGRRAALEGLIAIGVTSSSVNLLAKTIAARPRPSRDNVERFSSREIEMPASPSFPSGHAASAFAFSYAVGRHLPELAVPIRLLAGAVAYSRVHLGVHYPGDVAVGSIIGSGIAAMVAAAADRRS